MRLMLAGKIDQWFAKIDGSGVVFLMNVTDPAEAHTLLEKLPLGQADMMTFQLIPVWTPLAAGSAAGRAREIARANPHRPCDRRARIECADCRTLIKT